ncbi:MAG: transcriptional regulator [Rhodocyclales bacterium]|nr:transcriptional regulator [Rhodocyclales bacterium]
MVETPTFSRLWRHYWTEEERGEFAAWLAENPESGGVRVVYFNRMAKGEIWLLFMDAKAELDSMAGEVLREMKDEIEKTID